MNLFVLRTWCTTPLATKGSGLVLPRSVVASPYVVSCNATTLLSTYRFMFNVFDLSAAGHINKKDFRKIAPGATIAWLTPAHQSVDTCLF